MFFSESVFSSILGCLWGGSRRQRRGPSSLRICRIWQNLITPGYPLRGCGEYIYIYIYIGKGYRLCRRPLGPDEWMLGCLDAWMLGCLSLCSPDGRFGTNSNCILEAFGHLWCHLAWALQGCGSLWARLGQAGYPNEPFGTPVQAGAPI